MFKTYWAAVIILTIYVTWLDSKAGELDLATIFIHKNVGKLQYVDACYILCHQNSR